MDESSSHDQNREEGRGKKKLLASALLLALPALIPLVFLHEAEDTISKIVLASTSLCVALLNVMVLMRLRKWSKSLEKESTSDLP